VSNNSNDPKQRFAFADDVKLIINIEKVGSQFVCNCFFGDTPKAQLIFEMGILELKYVKRVMQEMFPTAVIKVQR
jgi:hypothetical protein